jgi:hypothetical protein
VQYDLKKLRSNAEKMQDKVEAEISGLSEMDMNQKVLALKSILKEAASDCKQERRPKKSGSVTQH